MAIPLSIGCGWKWKHATVIDFSSYNRDWLTKPKNIYCLALYRKSLSTLVLDHFSYCIWTVRADQKYILTGFGEITQHVLCSKLMLWL